MDDDWAYPHDSGNLHIFMFTNVGVDSFYHLLSHLPWKLPEVAIAKDSYIPGCGSSTVHDGAPNVGQIVYLWFIIFK